MVRGEDDGAAQIFEFELPLDRERKIVPEERSDDAFPKSGSGEAHRRDASIAHHTAKWRSPGSAPWHWSGVLEKALEISERRDPGHLFLGELPSGLFFEVRQKLDTVERAQAKLFAQPVGIPHRLAGSSDLLCQERPHPTRWRGQCSSFV